MPRSTSVATIPEVTHATVQIDQQALHYVSSGESGSPVVLVHGFPESWWAFRGVIPLLRAEHRVIAVDLPGFGDSGHDGEDYSSAFAAESLRRLIEQLDLGPVHLTGQDIAGPTTFRLAARHPELVRSFTGIETGLPGFGLEGLADVTHGGAWYIGVIAAPGIPQMLLRHREREFLAGFAYPAMSLRTEAISERDIDEFTRVYAQPNGFAGAAGLYRSMLEEGAEIQRLASAKLTMPVLSVGGPNGALTHQTMHAVADDVTERDLSDVGHLIALEDPAALAEALLDFYRTIAD